MKKLSAPFYRKIIKETLPSLHKKIFEGTFRSIKPPLASAMTRIKDYLKYHLYTKPAFKLKQSVGSFGRETASAVDGFVGAAAAGFAKKLENKKLREAIKSAPEYAEHYAKRILENEKHIKDIGVVGAGQAKTVAKNLLIASSPLLAAVAASDYYSSKAKESPFVVDPTSLKVMDNQAELKSLIDNARQDRNKSLALAAAVPALYYGTHPILSKMKPAMGSSLPGDFAARMMRYGKIGTGFGLLGALLSHIEHADLKNELAKKQEREKKAIVKVADEFSDKIDRDRMLSIAARAVPIAMIAPSVAAVMTGDPKKILPMVAMNYATSYLNDLVDNPLALTKLRWLANKQKWDDRDLDLTEKLLYDDMVIDEYTGLNQAERRNFIDRLEDLKIIKNRKTEGKGYYKDIHKIIEDNPSRLEKIKQRIKERTILHAIEAPARFIPVGAALAHGNL